MDSPGGSTPRSTPVKFTSSSVPRGQHHTRPTHSSSLLDEVLAEKKMALMQSPEVVQFLQKMQQEIQETTHMPDHSVSEGIDSPCVGTSVMTSDPPLIQGTIRTTSVITEPHSSYIGHSNMSSNMIYSQPIQHDNSLEQMASVHVQNSPLLTSPHVMCQQSVSQQTIQAIYVPEAGVTVSAQTSHHVPVPTVPTAQHYTLQRPGHNLLHTTTAHTLKHTTDIQPQPSHTHTHSSTNIPQMTLAQTHNTAAHAILNPVSAIPHIACTHPQTSIIADETSTFSHPTSTHALSIPTHMMSQTISSLSTPAHMSKYITHTISGVTPNVVCHQINQSTPQKPTPSHQSVSQKPTLSHQSVSQKPILSHQSVSQKPTLSHQSVSQKPTPSHQSVSQKPTLSQQSVSQKPTLSHQNVTRKYSVQNTGHSLHSSTPTTPHEINALQNRTQVSLSRTPVFQTKVMTPATRDTLVPSTAATSCHPSRPGDMHSDPNKTCLVTQWLNANIDIANQDVLDPDTLVMTNHTHHLPNFYREKDNNS